MLFGNDEEPLSYEDEIESRTYKDPRLQSIYEEEAVYSLTRIIAQAELDRLTDRRIVLITGLPLPNVTDRPETSIFDWEDLEIAGGLDKLRVAIAVRERFEQERENLTAEVYMLYRAKMVNDKGFSHSSSLPTFLSLHQRRYFA